MDREILFRAKSLEDTTKGQWIYGFYREFRTDKGNNYFIDSCESNESFFIDPATVGQYAGLTDKNGKKIFEGDIISVFGETINPRTKQKIPFPPRNATVMYYNKSASFLYRIESSQVSSSFRYTRNDGLDYEVVGTMFDMEVGK